MTALNPISKIKSCWKKIGTLGDRSCPELPTHIHCQNCPVYASMGRNLLERSLFENYRQEWTELFAQPEDHNPTFSKNLETNTFLKVMIFRLQQEWIALPAQIFQETTPCHKVHRIPHHSNQILRGLVNIRGELYLCVSLSYLLNLKVDDLEINSNYPLIYSRMLVMEKLDQTWVFEVDEIYGIHQLDYSELCDPPQNRGQGNLSYTQRIFRWNSHSVSYLNDDQLFTALTQKVSL